jgi:hypothetical protein
MLLGNQIFIFLIAATKFLKEIQCSTFVGVQNATQELEVNVVSNDFDIEKHFGTLINRRLLEKPSGLKYQTAEEAEYLKLHKCKDHGEVYSASYLISKTHILNHYIGYNLTTCNTEMASWMIMDTTMDEKKNKDGTLIQALDAMDFSVIHLSAFERLQRRHSRTSKGEKLVAIRNCTKVLHQRYLDKTLKLTNISTLSNSSTSLSQYLSKTVIVMPWLGSELGAGNSHITNRLEYLKACFWSFYIEYPNVVVAVKSVKDRDIAR